MRIERLKKTEQEKSEIRAELARVADPPVRTVRVCDPDCDEVCPTCASTNCACCCSKDCPKISITLTTDPNFPIENKIAPLAYELKRLGVYEPCWSCEGHNDNAGDLWKIPRVWFYCDSVVHVRLLSDVLMDLGIGELLNVPWQVRVTFSEDDNPSTTFSLEPVMDQPLKITLQALQQDIQVIAERLEEMVKEKASDLKALA